MTICLKTFFVIMSVTTLSGCAWSSEKIANVHRPPISDCKQAQYGTLDLELVKNRTLSENAYLFNCALSIVVPEIDEDRDSVRNRIKKKREIADFFASKELDVSYKDEEGNTLLMSVIVSSLSEEWKLNMIKRLLSKGCDSQVRNNYEKTAIDLAKFKESPKIIQLLSEYTQ